MEPHGNTGLFSHRSLAGPSFKPVMLLRPHTPNRFSNRGKFRLLSLPAELTLNIASFLPPRSIFALLLTSPAFGHLSSLVNALSRQDYTVAERGTLHVYTPLQFFCSRGIEPIVRRLLFEGADPNDVQYGPPKNQLSPLTHAVGYHSASIVSLLLEHGAHVNERHLYDQGYSPIDIAVGQPHEVHPQLLPDRQGYIRRAGQLPEIVQLLLAAGSDITALHPRRGTPLHMACAARDANPRIVSALIAAGADVHSRFAGYGPPSERLALGLDGDIQPIHYAASAGNMESVQLLLDAGADIEAATRNGIRPLDNAVLTMRKDVLLMLLAAGADMHTTTTVESLAAGSSNEVRSLMIDTATALGVADPWILLGNQAQWSELTQWLLLRGCTANWESMGAWGMTESHDRRSWRTQSYPFPRRG
ncbi:spectrin binding [Maublancomyces gigas]|uniref:Spectrin binding n=1 Tax=Discina gigas TaxID=1032678 RepID=A0ABR3GMD3_9PEZI